MNSSSSSIMDETGKSILAVTNTEMLTYVCKLVPESLQITVENRMFFIDKVEDLLDEIVADGKCFAAVCSVFYSWLDRIWTASAASPWFRRMIDVLVLGLFSKCIERKPLDDESQFNPVREIAQTLVRMTRVIVDDDDVHATFRRLSCLPCDHFDIVESSSDASSSTCQTCSLLR